MLSSIGYVIIGAIVIVIFGIFIMIARWYKKVPQGQALIRTGGSKPVVAFKSGMFVVPIIHMVEKMDLSVKTVEIARLKEDGLICQDNMRADIKVVFFVRVNSDTEAILKVAQTIGAARASDLSTLKQLFEAKFSEALKTVGKRFEFVELYDNREKFKKEIIAIIGSDLNGYVLDDCAIDYLEQTPIEFLKADNILDSEGIKKITELTAAQKVKANFIRREEEKTIKEQDVEAREAILEYERQLAEKEERQKREIANIKSREGAEIAKISEEERLRSEMVRIKTEEELAIAEENKSRQVVIAAKNKERAEAVENERVEKDRLLEQTEKERIVTLAEIEKQRAIEEEKRNIQDVIRERVMVEKKTVEEEEKIKDTREVAAANRSKQVAVIKAEEAGESSIIELSKTAEAEKLAAEIQAQKLLIDAEAEKNAAEKEAEARKIRAEAKAAEEATIGLSEAQVIEAKAKAKEHEGSLEAVVIEKKAQAEATAIAAKAEAMHKQGLLEAEVLAEKGSSEAKVTSEKGSAAAKALEEKLVAEAKGVEQKALAMKKLDGVGKEHEEFKLRLEKDTEVRLAEIDIQRYVAEAQAMALSEAFKQANIDIVGGEDTFINNVMNAINRGKTVDRLINNSEHLGDLKTALFGNGNGATGLLTQIKEAVKSSGFKTGDIKNLTLAALLYKLQQKVSDNEKGDISKLIDQVQQFGLTDQLVGTLL
ncbi:MAG: flotillin family protein [Saprospiraceae bacterium]|nr:flotillin family protein [Saprospiraceae bacterium]